MTAPIIYIDRSEIRDGKLDEFKAAMDEVVAFVEANEPQLISYGAYIDANATHVSVVVIHPDAESMEFHMDVAGPMFHRFAELINLTTIDVYGEVPTSVVSRLQQKAALLGGGTVGIHKRHSGFFAAGRAGTTS